MLTHEQNERICRIGPGTPWARCFAASGCRCAPPSSCPNPTVIRCACACWARTSLPFVNSSGIVGLLDEHCPASRRFTGAGPGGGEWTALPLPRLEIPRPMARSRTCPTARAKPIRERVRAPAYPVKEEGGLVWTFSGPRGPGWPPVHPLTRFMDAEPTNRAVVRINVACNYLQLAEGRL